MTFFDRVKSGVSNYFDKRKAQKEELEQIQKEVDAEARQIFTKEFKENALQVAKAKAYKDAAQKTGLQKLRAINRVRRLNESGSPPGSFFSKLSEYTKKNLAKREENLERTKVMREEANKIRQETANQRIEKRIPTKPNNFRQCNWKM